MHIAVEGIDGSGKTTLAVALAKKLEYKFISKPMGEIIGKSEYINCVPSLNKSQNEIVRSLFYACGNAYSVSLGENIITDRHLVSNFYHNSSEKNKKLFDTLIEIIGKPDLTILLSCENSIRKERMIARNPKDKDIAKVFEFDEKELTKMRDFLQEYKFKYIEIDNSKISTTEALEIVLKELQYK